MDIKVYKDASKIKGKVLGFTLRQFMALLMIFIGAVLMALNTFFFHINEILYQIPIMFLLFIGLFMTLVKINGLTGDRWLALKWSYLKKTRIRTYQTERIVRYERKDFIQSKKVKETNSFDENRKTTIGSLKKKRSKS